MKTSKSGFLLSALLSFLLCSERLHGAVSWGGPLMQRGIAALTCGGAGLDNAGMPIAASNAFTFGLADLRTPPPPMYGPCNASLFGPVTVPIWNAPMYHDPSWNAENLGNLYGLTIDAAGDIYAAAHGLYGTYQQLHHRYGNLGGGPTNLNAAGTVYKISGTTGAASVFAVIPGQQVMNINTGFDTGPGLGNIAFDRTHNQFFVSSLEDGKIYRVSASGTVLNSFDPLTPDNGAPGMPPRSERVWAVEVLNNEVFYSIWNNGDSSSPGVIRRVQLNGSGDFIPTSDAPVLTVPPQMWVQSGGTPVSDITFSMDGQTMILGCRTMFTDTTAYNHNSASHMAKLVGSTWTVVRTQNTGCNGIDGEAYGGVAYGEEGGIQDAIIWTTSADMAANYGPHGAFGVRVPDFAFNGQATNSYKVPYDPVFTNGGFDDRKGSGGDIEIMRLSDQCADISTTPVECPRTNGAPFTLSLNITNLGTATVHYVWLTPCPTSSLPAGAITAQPSPSGIVMLPTPLAPGAGTTVAVSLPPNVGGETVCFRVTLLDRQGKACCTQKVCVTVPPCDCASVIGKDIKCEVQPDGTIQYTIILTIQNLTHLSANPYGISYVSILPPTGFTPSFVTPTPNPIPPGGTGTVQLTYFGTPGPLCFNLGLHDDSLEECCAPEPVCLELPKCDPASDKPDTCAVETKAPCCPPAPGMATINYTICNNSTVPRTYTWTASPAAAPGCTMMLAASSFSPSSGTIGPIPPGGCMTVPINVRCEGFKPGDCAGFHVCASYNADVPPLCCDGVVYRPRQGEPVVKDVRVGGRGAEIPPRGEAPLAFDVTNLESAPMQLEIFLRDERGVLSFATADGSSSSLYSTTVAVPPAGTERFTVDARRIDNGMGVPDFTSVEVWTSATGAPGFGESILAVPVRLLSAGGTPDAPPAIKSVRLEPEPPKVVVTMRTVSGRRYRIEQASQVAGPWTAANCTTPDATVDPEGYVIGTGNDVSCYIDCDPASPKMFFRLVEQR